MRERLSQAADTKAFVAAAQREGYPFSESELRQIVAASLPGVSELSDQDLEKVAGGSFNFGGGFFQLPAVQNLRGILIGL